MHERYGSNLALRAGPGRVRLPWPLGFAGLFFVATMSRGVLLSVIPLELLELLGSAQRVSIVYFTVSIAGIAASLSLPGLVRVLGVRATFFSGVIAMTASAAMMTASSAAMFVAGFLCHVVAVAAIEVALSIYVTIEVPRRALTRFEPNRVLCTVAALAVGPWLGVYLESRVAHWLPFGVAIGFAALSVGYFLWLGLAGAARSPVALEASNPLRHLIVFFAQPRMRLAWGLALAKSSWWIMFSVYTPIYAERAGLGALVGAGIVSVGTAWIASVPLWGWLARRVGVRRLMLIGFCAGSALTGAVFWTADEPWITAGLLLVAALGATILDGAGHVLFFRAVRPRERSVMTGAYLTYQGSAQLAAPGLFAVLLVAFELPIVFLASAAWMLVAASYTRHVPRGM